MYYIYLILFPNGKVYVGQSKKIKERWVEHIRESYGNSNRKVYNAIRKYGAKNIEFIIIDKADSKKDIDEKEIEYIALHHSYINDPECNGYNMTIGGEGGDTWVGLSEEQKNIRKEKFFSKRKGINTNRVNEPEVREQISRTMKKVMKDRTEEEWKPIKEAISKGVQKYYQTEESKRVRKRVGDSHKEQNNPMSLTSIAFRNNCSIEEARKLTPTYGKPRNEYTRMRASETHRGKVVSEETKEKLRIKNIKYYYTITNRETKEVFTTYNLKLWCSEHNMDRSILSKRANTVEQRPRKKLIEWDIEKTRIT